MLLSHVAIHESEFLGALRFKWLAHFSLLIRFVWLAHFLLLARFS